MTREALSNILNSVGRQTGKSAAATTISETSIEHLIKELTATLERLEEEHIDQAIHRIVSTDKHGREII